MRSANRSKLFLVCFGTIVPGMGVSYAFGCTSSHSSLGLASLLLLALVFATAASYLIVELAVRPARGLTSLALRMARGDLSAESPFGGGDPFVELGRALDHLVTNLSVSIGNLRDERDRLRGILAGMQEGVLVLDGGGRVVLVNTALREMLLLSAEAVGKSLLEALRHADLKDLFDGARTAASPVSREIEVTGLKPRRILVRAARLPNQADETFAVFVDVTEIRRLESMRRDFVANVSHELRTPVTAIRSAAETLQGGLPEEPAMLSQFVAIIERNASRLQDLVEDVLELSRIESRQLRLHMESLELRAAYGQVLSLFREQAGRKQIALINEAERGMARIKADRRALEHVLTNLVDNAVKYCGVNSRIRMGCADLGDSVRLFVADDGPGIETRHLDRIFERFYRVDAGRSRNVGGTGLGLSIVKHLVEAMGGEVAVESLPGAGTTFSFTLRKGEPELTQAVA